MIFSDANIFHFSYNLAKAAANFSTSLVDKHLIDIEITGSGTKIDSYTREQSNF